MNRTQEQVQDFLIRSATRAIANMMRTAYKRPGSVVTGRETLPDHWDNQENRECIFNFYKWLFGAEGLIPAKGMEVTWTEVEGGVIFECRADLGRVIYPPKPDPEGAASTEN